jgi:hypothetical protein
MVALTVLSFGYELYRATMQTGVSPHDSLASLGMLVPLYLLGLGLAYAVRRGHRWGLWGVLAYAALALVTSLTYYNPVVLPARQPGVIDWVENIAYTAMVAVVAFKAALALRASSRVRAV